MKCLVKLASVPMISHEITQLARTSLLLLDYAGQQGLDRERLMRNVGLSKENLEDPDSRIKAAKMVRLWRAVDEALGDPVLGLHVAASVEAKQLGLVGYAIYHSRDGYSAVHRFARYVHVLSEAVQLEVDQAGANTVITWQVHPALATLRHPVETGVALLVALARDITGTHVNPVRVDLPGPHPEMSGEYRSYFECPVNFEQAAARVEFSHEHMSLPTRAPDATLVAYLDDLATIKLNPLEERDESMVEAVRRTLWSMLPGGRPDLWRTAAELGISVRTLQRRLGEEGSSFSGVLDELRRDLSNELLADRSLSVAEVAFMLGYSEPSAFQRAYRRWWGVSARRRVA